MSPETDLVGAVATWPEILADVRPLVDPGDFEDAELRAAYAACCEEATAGRSWTYMTLERRLGAGWGTRLAELACAVVSPAHAVHNARLIRARANKERLQALLRSALADLDEIPATMEAVEEFTERLSASITAIIDRGGDAGRQLEAGDALALVATRLSERRPNQGIDTGISDLDRVLLGMRPGDLIVVAGRTSMGKTALGLQIALNASRAGHMTALLSLEMPSEQLAARVASNVAEIDGSDIRRGEVTTANVTELRAEAEAMTKRGSLWLIDDTHTTLGRVYASLRRMRRRRGLALAVIDYVQRIRVPGFRPSERHLEVAAATRGLKEYAKELGIPIVALAQLSRDAEQSKPTLAHLRESGAIEMDADAVVLLHGARDASTVTAIVAKNRDGMTGEVELAFLRSIARIAGLEKSTTTEVYR